MWVYPQDLNNNKNNTVSMFCYQWEQSPHILLRFYQRQYLHLCNRSNPFWLEVWLDFIWLNLLLTQVNGAWSCLTHAERKLWMQKLTWLLGSFHLWGFRSFTESVWSLSGGSDDKCGPDRDVCQHIYQWNNQHVSQRWDLNGLSQLHWTGLLAERV